MAYVFQLPDVGEGIHEGTVVEWLVAPGDPVQVDQPLVKVETDKAVVELPSPQAGTVVELHAEPGDTVRVGEPLVTLGEAGETGSAGPTAQRKVVAKAAQPRAAQQGAAGAAPAAARRRPPATPRTRRLARELGVDLEQVRGTGPGGRITDEDVRRAAARPEPAPRPAPPPRAVEAGGAAGAAEEVERVPLPHLRRVIAEAMSRSKHTHAHVTHVDEADVTDLVALQKSARAEIEERLGVRLTLLPFFVRAVTTALAAHPKFNATFDEERQELAIHRACHMGVAVDTPEGLIVPVVRNAHAKSLVELAREIADLAERARTRRLALDELRGGTFTITNIGPLGGVLATPIINGDQLAIVGLHTIKERPAVVGGEIAIRKTMYLSISFDHRLIDGAEAARFMSDVVRLVENPGLLMAQL